MTPSKKIKLLFAGRVTLWLIALVSTGYWMWLSGELYHRGIYNPEEYAKYLRPVLYTGVIIAVAAIGLSFVLYGQSEKIKKQMRSSITKKETEQSDDSLTEQLPDQQEKK